MSTAEIIDVVDVTNGLVEKARIAFSQFRNANQEFVDEVVTAIAWSLYEPGNASALAALAVDDTELGNVNDKFTKNRRKTFGTLRDLMRVRTVGVIEEDPKKGIVKYAKPVGVCGCCRDSFDQPCGNSGKQVHDGSERTKRSHCCTFAFRLEYHLPRGRTHARATD